MNSSFPPKRATLRDVARSAGVSVATVSRVLNGSELVTSDTRNRVTQAIDTLGFLPSAAARTLNSGRSRTVGALVPTLDHSIFARYLDTLENRLSERGYALVVAVTGGQPEVEERKAMGLIDMGVDGLIVSGKNHTEGFDALVERFHIPTLITSYYDPSARYPTVGYDNGAIAVKAIDFLKSLGHHRILVVHGPTDTNDRIAARIEAIAQNARGIEVGFSAVSMDVAGGADAVRQMTGAATSPTALLCLSDVQALGALFELQRQGISVPEEISLMGFDDLEWSEVSQPSITSIHLPAEAMGDAAGDAIVDWITSGLSAKPVSLDASILPRASTRNMTPRLQQ
ncbi:LacI family DNA-binding transcriptional regulator [Gymnodinialimonas hymeniacidonis]|uniref:LacI family DNA-binding transcriptional regulator n=1 Tax=Gymnodinialimonas hymeniacidonis TaxID=3126508 RepID=UPI0034C5F0B5